MAHVIDAFLIAYGLVGMLVAVRIFVAEIAAVHSGEPPRNSPYAFFVKVYGWPVDFWIWWRGTRS